jgi:tetraacyldisaccharide 4'-kinase
LKYDFALPGEPPADLAAWIANAAPRCILIAASTLDPEESIALEAWRTLPESTLLIVAPRRPERFDEVAALLGPDCVRRSRLDRPSPILLLDTIGELASLFRLPYPQVVFVGGSINPWGGHNILEPAFAGRAILTGPHMQNFAEIDRDFRAADAVRIVNDARELAEAARELFVNDGGRGDRARALAESKRGATDRAVAEIELGAPLTHRPCAWFFQGLSWIWRAGVALDRRFTTPKRLPKPVISVGGLSMGGAGKTPFVLRLAEVLTARGHRVGILTRGYRRRDKVPIVYPPGERAPIELTGDEAQLFLRAGHAWVGIGANRYLTGRLIEKHVDLYLLDDGFQHWALHRDLDLVLLDELDPWAGGGVFPAGLLREGPEALARATSVVRPRKIAVNPPPPGRYSAFCGIANPVSFLRTLRQCQVEVEDWREFPDHHRYTVEDLAGLKPPILTTAKDFANLPAGVPPVQVVEIKMETPDEAALIESIEARLEMAGTIGA